MFSWIALVVVFSLPLQAPDANADSRPQPTVVNVIEYEEESDRLEKRASELGQDYDYLKVLLAKKKAEFQTAKADLALYRLTHEIEPVRATAVRGRVDKPGADELVELSTTREKGEIRVENERITLRGRVVDAENRPIAEASVSVIDANENEQSLQTSTDANGNYSIVVLASGRN